MTGTLTAALFKVYTLHCFFTRLISLTAICCLSLLPSTAQHCPFDHSGAIIVSPRNVITDSVIDGLNIFLCDSAGNPYSEAPRGDGYHYGFPCQFHQNPSQTTFRGYIDNNNPAEPRQIRFPFASNDYLLICNRSYEAHNVFLRAIDPQQRYFESSVVKIIPIDVYPLCGNYDEAKYHDSRIGGRIYQPIIIRLHPIRSGR